MGFKPGALTCQALHKPTFSLFDPKPAYLLLKSKTFPVKAVGRDGPPATVWRTRPLSRSRFSNHVDTVWTSRVCPGWGCLARRAPSQGTQHPRKAPAPPAAPIRTGGEMLCVGGLGLSQACGSAAAMQNHRQKLCLFSCLVPSAPSFPGFPLHWRLCSHLTHRNGGVPRLPYQLKTDQQKRKTCLWPLHESTRSA